MAPPSISLKLHFIFESIRIKQIIFLCRFWFSHQVLFSCVLLFCLTCMWSMRKANSTLRWQRAEDTMKATSHGANDANSVNRRSTLPLTGWLWTAHIQTALPSSAKTRPRGVSSTRTPGIRQKQWSGPTPSPHTVPRVETRCLFAAHGHFLTQVIKNRPCRVNQPILDYLNQAEALTWESASVSARFHATAGVVWKLLSVCWSPWQQKVERQQLSHKLTWCVVPSISTGTMKSGLLMG